MVDANLLARTWLAQDQVTLPDGEVLDNPVLSLIDTSRIYAGHIPAGFDPRFGNAIVVRTGGGTASATGGGSAHSEIVGLINPRLQITVWGGGEPGDWQIVRQIYGAIFDWLHGKSGVVFDGIGRVLSCQEITEGQDVADPHSNFATVVGFWSLSLMPLPS